MNTQSLEDLYTLLGKSVYKYNQLLEETEVLGRAIEEIRNQITSLNPPKY